MVDAAILGAGLWIARMQLQHDFMGWKAWKEENKKEGFYAFGKCQRDTDR